MLALPWHLQICDASEGGGGDAFVHSEQKNADDCKVSCKRLAQCRMWNFDGQICRLYNHLRDFDQDFERAHNSTAGCLFGGGVVLREDAVQVRED